MKTVKAKKDVFMQSGILRVYSGIKISSAPMNIFSMSSVKFLRALLHKDNAVYFVFLSAVLSV